MSDPERGAAAVPMQGALRALEGALLGIILAFSLWTWARGAWTPAAPGAPAGDSMEALRALTDQGRGGAVVAFMGLVVVASLAALGLALRRAAAVGVAGLRDAWRARATGLDPGLSVGHFLLAFGLAQVAQGPALLLLPGARLSAEAPGATRFEDLTVLAPYVYTWNADRAVFSPDLGAVRLSLEGMGARIDGVEVGPGRHRLRAGAAVQVMDQELTIVSAPSATRWLLALAAGQALGLAALLGALRATGALPRVGLRREGLADEARRGAWALLAFLPLYALGLAAWARLGGALGAPAQGHPLIEALEREGATLAPIIIVQAVLLAPLTEELLYRGLLAPACARVAGALAATLLSALVFGAQHPGFVSLLPMTLLGVLFAGLLVTSPRRSLVGSIVAHALFNAVNLVVAVGVQVS